MKTAGNICRTVATITKYPARWKARPRLSGFTWLAVVVGLLLLLLPAAVKAQDYTYTTNNGAITITGYTGSGGAVTITNTINGLPVTSIGNQAFQDCPSLTSVMIGTNVTSIGVLAFCDCHNLTAITVDGQNSVYSSVAGVLFNKSQTTLIQCPGSIIASSYTIPNGVTNIGLGAFSSCSSLTNVAIPNSVTSIGVSAFNACSSLASVTIPSSVTSIGAQAFRYCPLTSVTIPASVTSIGGGAFDACTSLTAITVEALNPVYSSVAGVLFNKSQTTLIEYPGGKVGGYTIPASVTSIGGGAFYYCTSLTGVTIPNSVTNIGNVAFMYCSSLTNVIVGSGVTSIGDEAFYDCGSSLTGVYFQGNAPSFGSDVFYGDNNATVYYLTCTTGWGTTFGSRPTALWTGLPDVTVTVVANPSLGGTATGNGTYPVCSSRQISASANSGWTFTGWSDGSTDNPYTITVPASDTTYTANFVANLTVSKLQAKVNFAKTNADSCTVKGILNLPVGYNFAGKSATLDIGGAEVSFTLGSKGSGLNDLSTFKKPTYNKRTGLWTFNATLKGSWQTSWAEYGMTNSTIAKPGILLTNFPVILILDIETLMETTNLHYTSKQDKSGMAK